ncbi:MAG: PrsW family glutamic-type intramembrane protease, partial [Eubacteriales bacterium]|nr:PrsW family glutamic-type intramembrane protease [Clostridiales bacterium]MDY5709510.1 PrsW family glutamic-type intramembrane protease [Eubacteriales bacterium]
MLLFTLPLFAVALIYGAAALLPAIYLMKYIYRKDTVEKEPSMLLMSLLIYGVIAALISIALEGIGTKILNSLMDQSTVGYTLVLAFVVVAMVEEGAKFAMLKRRTWREINFNYRFDGIVYAVFISLGFAAFENIGYVLGYGLSVAPARALLAVPGHMCFGVFM